jgi:dihydrofolate reductase
MGTVFANIALSLDGYMAPDGMTLAHWETPDYQGWGAKWGALMAWLLSQQTMRDKLGFGPGGETGPIDDMVHHTFERAGAQIMGKRMFEQGERSWPEEAPFGTPVFVLTHEAREPWARPGGTVFHFVTEGPEAALEQARAAAQGRDIRISGGAATLDQFLNMGAVEELEIALAPVLFGGGRRLFADLRAPCPQFRIDRVLAGPHATHLRYLRA